MATGTQLFTLLELANPVAEALREFGTSTEDANQGYTITGDSTFSLKGRTRDGRGYTGKGKAALKGMYIHVKVDIEVEGAVDMGPFPDCLVRVENAVRANKAVIDKEDEKSARRNEVFYSQLVEAIFDWKDNKPVDKKALRSTLRFVAQGAEIRSRQSERGSALQTTWDEVRVACNAALRLVK